MGIERFFVDAVTIIRPGARTDGYNNTLPDWDDTTDTDTRGWLHRQAGDEVLGNRDAQVSDWILYLAPETDIEPTDRVVANGTTYEVFGPPLHAHTPRGQHHLEATLRVIEG